MNHLKMNRLALCTLFFPLVTFGFLCFSPLTVPDACGQQKEVVIGCTLPMTGIYSATGRYFIDAYRYWEIEVNEQGGLLGHKVRLIIYDDKSDAPTCVNLYQKLITVDKVNFIVAGFPTPVHLPVMALAEKYKMVMTNGGSNAAALIEKGGYTFTFTTLYTDRGWANPIFDFLTTLPPEQRPQKLGFIVQVNPFLQGVVSSANDYAKEKRFEIFGTETYTSDTQDFTAMVGKFKAANVDFLFGANNYPAGLSLIRTIAERDYKPKALYMAVGPTTPRWTEDLGPRTDNVFTSTSYWHALKFDQNEAFVAGMKKHYGYVATRECGLAYTALQVLTQAIRRAKTFDQIKLRDFIRTNKFETVAGTMEFDKFGIGAKGNWLMQIQGDKQYLVYPESVRQAKPIYPRR